MRSLYLYQGKVLSISLLFTGLVSFFLLYSFGRGKRDQAAVKLLMDLNEAETIKCNNDSEEPDEEDTESTSVSRKIGKSSNQSYNEGGGSSITPCKKTPEMGAEHTPLTSNTTPARWKSEPVLDSSYSYTDKNPDMKLSSIHTQIEDIDKRGKALFKSKNYIEAAEVYTEALVLIENNKKLNEKKSTINFNRHFLTLTNNRSAMYEKAGLPDLALHDCDAILEIDTMHIKARNRKLRILESLSRHSEALVEVCALQLKFMKENKDNIRMGVPVIPPVPQSKLEELMAHILPKEMEAELAKVEKKYSETERPFPSNYTVSQLLQSFSGYNTWVSAAAKDEPLDFLSVQIKTLGEFENERKIELLFRRGRKYAYHKKFADCKIDILEALFHLEKLKLTKEVVIKSRIDARIWEWAGMFRHLCHDLKGASRCYESCLELEPDNVEILVKLAGVEMDDGNYEDALSYFDKALSFDPTATDALLHRANLFLLQKEPLKAKAELVKCLELRPDYSLARLRLATVLMTTEEVSDAQSCLDLAANIDPQSSEVRSYLGEMYFSRGDFAEARREFELAIKYDPENPTAYFNAALVVINSPPAGGVTPDISEAVHLLEKTIKVDPHFYQAYVHLGQLKLSMAMDLTGAKKVVSLYDKGLGYCRRSEEMKDIVSMKILAIAQVEAASILKMDTFAMQ